MYDVTWLSSVDCKRLLITIHCTYRTALLSFFAFQRFLADIISVLGMTISDGRECLKYRMVGSKEELESWGHEYVRSV